MIHNTAIIDPKAKISSGVSIGAFTVIGPNVEIGENTIIQPHVSIIGNTKVMGYPAKNIREFLRDNK